MKEATQFTAVYVALFLILGALVFSSLKSCAHSIDQDAERAIAYQAQFQNANEHEVFVRKLGDE
ncbi:hypothetical protein ACN19N_05630 [Acinetobacter sp. LF10]|uniref:hypothetical protein n=1 Tax=Acinetobacter sp. LF10 TaxID=3403576 RepID=UPI003B216FB0